MTIKTLYASATGCSNILGVNVSHSHGASTSTATVECISCSRDIGDTFSVDLGYVGDHSTIFSGYIKQIDRKAPDGIYRITAHDVMVRALDYWLVSCNPEQPFTRSNILVEFLVRDVLAEAGLTNYGYTPTSFVFATGDVPAEVNLVSAYDYCNGLADLLTWHLYADVNGKCWFVNRKPYPMTGTSGQIGDSNDSPIGSITDTSILAATSRFHERDLRNRVVVYGAEGIYACAYASSPYLPGDFYKTAVLSSQLITDQGLAETIASYNLGRWNRPTYEISVSTLGDSSYVARNTINITCNHLGISSDEYYIYSSEHKWDANGYITSLELRR